MAAHTETENFLVSFASLASLLFSSGFVSVLLISFLSATVGQFGRYAIRHDIVITIIIISASGPLIESALRVNANMTALRLRDTIDGV